MTPDRQQKGHVFKFWPGGKFKEKKRKTKTDDAELDGDRWIIRGLRERTNRGGNGDVGHLNLPIGGTEPDEWIAFLVEHCSWHSLPFTESRCNLGVNWQIPFSLSSTSSLAFQYIHTCIHTGVTK